MEKLCKEYVLNEIDLSEEAISRAAFISARSAAQAEHDKKSKRALVLPVEADNSTLALADNALREYFQRVRGAPHSMSAQENRLNGVGREELQLAIYHANSAVKDYLAGKLPVSAQGQVYSLLIGIERAIELRR